MQILLIHQGFPGQFKHLIPQLKERGHRLWAISGWRSKEKMPAGVYCQAYQLQRCNTTDIHPLVLETESKVIRGEAVAEQAALLKQQNFHPDLILGHPGWGEMLFLADLWPDVPQMHYVEFFHGVPGTDNDIQDRYSPPQQWQDRAKARMKNVNHLANLNQMSCGITPTRFQHSLLPDWAQARTQIIHDGIDTEWLCPDSKACLPLAKGRDLRVGDPVITFVNRTYEPYRGVHIFLEALAKLQEEHPQAQALLVGADSPKVSYGANRKDGIGWLTALRQELGPRLDWSRIHPLGLVSHKTLKQVFQVSTVHIYLTYPFVLSWSLLEAMSCGALIIGSATEPVKEVIVDQKTGLLVPFGDANSLAKQISKCLQEPDRFIPLRKNARQHIKQKYNLPSCLKEQIKLIESFRS
ncbi:MAG: glycosyl transferase family 1 [Gammaproteobacteria bacterium]|nr:glycosyl transferase family 1 [Gammaproteobacteria bacterium]